MNEKIEENNTNLIMGKPVEIINLKGEKEMIKVKPLGISMFHKFAKITQFYNKTMDKSIKNMNDEERSKEAIRVFCEMPQDVLIILGELISHSLHKIYPTYTEEQIDTLGGYNAQKLLPVVMEVNSRK